MSQVLSARRTGVPSPLTNAKIRQLYGRGAGALPFKIFGDEGNERLVPIAQWSHVRLRILITSGLGGRLSLQFADGRGQLVGSRVQANSLLSGVTTVPLEGETVQVGNTVYAFRSSGMHLGGRVLIGATAEESIDNLVAAITVSLTPAGLGEGVVYSTGTTLNVLAYAVKASPTSMLATATRAGTSGNGVLASESLTNGSWNNSPMSGGVDGEIADDDTLIQPDVPLEINIPGIHGSPVEHLSEPYLDVYVSQLTEPIDVAVFDAMGSGLS